MHAAAMGDTLGISCSLIGLMIFSGLNFTTFKMMLVVAFLWFASPVSSHLLSNENLKKYCQVYENLADLEKELLEEEQEKTGRDMV